MIDIIASEIWALFYNMCGAIATAGYIWVALKIIARRENQSPPGGGGWERLQNRHVVADPPLPPIGVSPPGGAE